MSEAREMNDWWWLTPLVSGLIVLEYVISKRRHNR